MTRAVLLEEIGGIGQRPLRLEDLHGAEEVFLTSTTRELLPVSEIDGVQIRSGGETRRRLLTAFREYVRRYTAEHAVLTPQHP